MISGNTPTQKPLKVLAVLLKNDLFPLTLDFQFFIGFIYHRVVMAIYFCKQAKLSINLEPHSDALVFFTASLCLLHCFNVLGHTIYYDVSSLRKQTFGKCRCFLIGLLRNIQNKTEIYVTICRVNKLLLKMRNCIADYISFSLHYLILSFIFVLTGMWSYLSSF